MNSTVTVTLSIRMYREMTPVERAVQADSIAQRVMGMPGVIGVSYKVEEES